MVCPYCSRRITDESEKCEFCGQVIEKEVEPEKKEGKKSNVWLGTLGGLLGAFLGGAVIFFGSQIGGPIGTVAAMLLSFCTLKGYRLLGKRLSRGGIMISMALIAVVTYLADRLDWACRVASWQAEQVIETGGEQLSVFSAFMLVPTLIDAGNIDFTYYLINLAIMYVFCAVGAFFTLRSILKNQ